MPYTILVIDDEPSVRETASDLLESAGYVVLVAPGGHDGLAMVRAVRPDLILLDYYMPGMNGLEVVKKLKADPLTQRIPVIALTVASAEYANELSRAGCVGFIPKPFEPSDFLRVIAEVVGATVGRRREGPGSADV